MSRVTRKSRKPSPARRAAITALLALVQAEYPEARCLDLVVWESDGEGQSVLTMRPGWERPLIAVEPATFA